MVALRTIDGAQNQDVGFVFDPRACISRSEAEISNNGIAWMAGIDFPANSADEFFVLTDIAERPTFKGGGLDPRDRYFRDAGLRGLEGRQYGSDNSKSSREFHLASPNLRLAQNLIEIRNRNRQQYPRGKGRNSALPIATQNYIIYLRSSTGM